MSLKVHPSWTPVLEPYTHTPAFTELKSRLTAERQAGQVVYPPASQWFAALDLCPLNHVKVVILGQDPYHGPGQAHGLSFSVPDGVPLPPSLRNIYQEIQADLGGSWPSSGNLTRWAQQGVLLLNASLSVRAHQANSHADFGWHPFTDHIIRAVSDACPAVVFLLWGRFAQNKATHVDTQKHLVLTAPHPSPLSAHRGFFGCQHFSQANRWLWSQGLDPIVWTPE